MIRRAAPPLSDVVAQTWLAWTGMQHGNAKTVYPGDQINTGTGTTYHSSPTQGTFNYGSFQTQDRGLSAQGLEVGGNGDETSWFWLPPINVDGLPDEEDEEKRKKYQNWLRLLRYMISVFPDPQLKTGHVATVPYTGKPCPVWYIEGGPHGLNMMTRAIRLSPLAKAIVDGVDAKELVNLEHFKTEEEVAGHFDVYAISAKDLAGHEWVAEELQSLFDPNGSYTEDQFFDKMTAVCGLCHIWPVKRADLSQLPIPQLKVYQTLGQHSRQVFMTDRDNRPLNLLLGQRIPLGRIRVVPDPNQDWVYPVRYRTTAYTLLRGWWLIIGDNAHFGDTNGVVCYKLQAKTPDDERPLQWKLRQLVRDGSQTMEVGAFSNQIADLTAISQVSRMQVQA